MEKGYPWPCGTYVDAGGFEKIMMAMETNLSADGLSYTVPKGTAEEAEALKESYNHLSKLRDEVVEMGILPPLSDWSTTNPNLA